MLCQFTEVGTLQRTVWVNPLMVLNVVSYNTTSTSIFMAAGKADSIYVISVTEPAEQVAGVLGGALRQMHVK